MLSQKVILISPPEMELWLLKHPGESFSAWVREQIAADVIPETPESPLHQATLEQNRCDRNLPCHQCNQPNCADRVAPYNI
jgi:hypothetical protein